MYFVRAKLSVRLLKDCSRGTLLYGLTAAVGMPQKLPWGGKFVMALPV